MEITKINDRLKTAVPYVREGYRLADVGTDHAYLPIYLMQTCKISGGIAADINKGPLEKARENIVKYGFEESIKTVLCDGLSKIHSEDVDDVAVFGMGGELILKIIDEAPWLKDSGKRLILQPMTHPEKLREYLASEGYKVIGESLSLDRGKIYQTLCAEYDGKKRQFDILTLHFGEYVLANRSPLLLELMQNTLRQLDRKILGKKSGGEDAVTETELYKSIEKYIRGNENEN